MKFTVLQEFKHNSPVAFEPGNSHDTEKCGISEAQADALHAAGLIHLDGREDKDLATQPVTVRAENVEYT